MEVRIICDCEECKCNENGECCAETVCINNDGICLTYENGGQI